MTIQERWKQYWCRHEQTACAIRISNHGGGEISMKRRCKLCGKTIFPEELGLPGPEVVRLLDMAVSLPPGAQVIVDGDPTLFE